MTISNFLQFCGVAAVLAAIIALLSVFVSVNMKKYFSQIIWVLYANTFLFLFAFMGIYLAQIEEGGLLGTIGFVIVVLGVSFANSERKFGNVAGYQLATLLFSVAFIIFGIVSWGGGFFPRWVPLAWFMAILFGLPGQFIKPYEALGDRLGVIFFAVGMIGAGYTLFVG